MNIENRKCTVCKKAKLINEFEKDKSKAFGHGYTCKSCKRKIGKKKAIEYKFGITLEKYNEMLKTQNTGCAICGKPPTAKKRLCVDHDHSTNKIRGLLCGKCNRAIGLLNDNIALLRNAINYLETKCRD